MVTFFFSSRRRHTRWNCDWSSDVCSSDLRSVGLSIGQDGDGSQRTDNRAGAVTSERDLCFWCQIWLLSSLKSRVFHDDGGGAVGEGVGRSEERRVGKECRCGELGVHQIEK